MFPGLSEYVLVSVEGAQQKVRSVKKVVRIFSVSGAAQPLYFFLIQALYRLP